MEAEAQAHALLEAFPLSGKAWQVLGHALHAQGKPAIHALERAVSLLPDDSVAHYNLGVALARKGQTDEAIHQFQEALRLKPDFAYARRSLEVVLAAKARSSQPSGASTNR